MRHRGLILWVCVAAGLIVPFYFAATSPLLEWRDPIYRIAGYAGVAGLALMLLQPLLAGGYLGGLRLQTSRRLHRASGTLLFLCVVLHVVMLWITSPPDVIDALLIRSPTPFAIWGVLAMWAAFGAAILAVFRPKLPLRVWRFGHTCLVLVTVFGTVAHAVLIEGTMEQLTKIALCAAVLLALGKTVYDLRAWSGLRRTRRQ